MIGENAIEVCNVLASLINQEGAARLKLDSTFLPGNTPPNDAIARLLALGRRLDVNVDIGGYGSGLLSLSYAS
jgi:hypothetical protein